MKALDLGDDSYVAKLKARFHRRLVAAFLPHPDLGTKCLLWTGYRESCGYGMIGIRHKKIIKTHRLAWLLRFGSIPEGVEVCHKCDVPECVNVEHLFIGSHADNMKDGTSKSRFPHGEKHHWAKHSEATVVAIRSDREQGFKYREIAEKHGVSVGYVGHCLSGKRWTHINANEERVK